jgi:hypothetical protein
VVAVSFHEGKGNRFLWIDLQKRKKIQLKFELNTQESEGK